MAHVLITGATGYLGRALSERLVQRGHHVRGLIRTGSEQKLVPGVESLVGDALSSTSVRAALESVDVVVHLVGTPHPAPWKQDLFERIDRASLFATAAAVHEAARPGLVYVSVAHPAPALKGYIAVRMECEAELRRRGLNATILRPWYVLGPGHRWPALLQPLYRLAESIPSLREGALRLGLVTHAQMTGALAWTVEHPAPGIRLLDVPAIRRLSTVVERPEVDPRGASSSAPGPSS